MACKIRTKITFSKVIHKEIMAIIGFLVEECHICNLHTWEIKHFLHMLFFPKAAQFEEIPLNHALHCVMPYLLLYFFPQLSPSEHRFPWVVQMEYLRIPSSNFKTINHTKSLPPLRGNILCQHINLNMPLRPERYYKN